MPTALTEPTGRIPPITVKTGNKTGFRKGFAGFILRIMPVVVD
jgi:hypothetical protein